LPDVIVELQKVETKYPEALKNANDDSMFPLYNAVDNNSLGAVRELVKPTTKTIDIN